MNASDKDGWQIPSDYERLVKLEKVRKEATRLLGRTLCIVVDFGVGGDYQARLRRVGAEGRTRQQQAPESMLQVFREHGGWIKSF